MASRQQFLQQVWSQIINAPLSEVWIENVARGAEKDPSAPFADVAPIVERLLQRGATRRDLSLLCRFAAYEATFELLYLLEDPGVDDPVMLHESLLSADPSGKEGRPGSAPPK